VEVQFKDGVAPSIARPAAPGVAADVQSASVELGDFNRIVQAHGLQRAESTFRTPVVEADLLHAAARREGFDAPHLRSFVTLHFPQSADTPQIARELEALEDVVRAVPVPKAAPPQTPLDEPLVGANDQVVADPATGLQNQWYLFRCRVNQAWTVASGAGVVIADIDWGFRTTHEDLASRLDLTRAFNAADGGTNVSFGTEVGHGTAVMGIAGAADNGAGMAGIAFGASLWPIQANEGPGPLLGGNPWARAIDWVRTADSGGRRKVIVLEVQTTLGGNYEQVPSVSAAIQSAIAAGIVVCVAAGNGGKDAGVDDAGNPFPPTGSILVGATGFHPTQNPRAAFSNWGPHVVVSAPGDSAHDLTCSTGSDNAYRNGFGGTSGATPKVAATAALMLSVNPSLTHAQIRSVLNTTGSPVVTEAGRPVGTFLNCEAAVRHVMGTDAAERLDVFVRGMDQALYCRFQVAPGAGWSSFESLGGWLDRLAVGRNADGRLEVFVRSNDGAVWHRWQLSPGGAWSGWTSRGGWVDLVAVGRNADGRLELLGRGSDGALNQQRQASIDTWSPWTSLGGWIDRLTIGTNADGRLQAFARGSDGGVWTIAQTAPSGAWGSWVSMGGTGADLLTVARNADGRLQIFARGPDNAVWQKAQSAPNGNWGDWARIGGWVSEIAVDRNADGRLVLFGIGPDSALWVTWQTAPNGAWANPISLGGWIDRLAISRNIDGRLEVCARSADAALWHIGQTAPGSAAVTPWVSLGGQIDMVAFGPSKD
jgi:subtilisin family serine protease